MAKTEATIQLEHDIRQATLKMGVFGCLEVTIGFGGKQRVDYMTYDTKGIFRCYEIKVSKSDFHSKHSKSFVGHYNYFVLTKDLYDQVQDEIPDWVGCYVGQECVKKAKKQDIDQQVFSMRRSVNGRSTLIEIPYTNMLKDSFIRSLYRDSQKLYRSKNTNYVDRTRQKIDWLERTLRDYKQRYQTLYNNVRLLIGRSSLRLLTGEHIHEQDVQNTLTLHQRILTMSKHDLAEYLHSYQGKVLSVSAIEKSLNLCKEDEDNGGQRN